ERLGAVMTLRHLEPEVHRRLAAGEADPLLAEHRKEELALAPVELAGRRDVLLIRPRHDCGTLYEHLRRRADRRPELLERADQPGITRPGPGAGPRHR